MSLNLSDINLTNSIVNLQNQIDNLDVDSGLSTRVDDLELNKQDVITENTEIEVFNITSNINFIDTIDPNNYNSISYNSLKYIEDSQNLFVSQIGDLTTTKQDKIDTDTTLQLNTLHADVITIEGGDVLDLLDEKQDIINDGDLTIAKTAGLQTALNGKQNEITQATNLPGFNMTSTASLNFLSTGQGQSGNLNFFNPTNQLDVKQLNYTKVNNIETQLTDLSTNKQDIINASTNLTIGSLTTAENINATKWNVKYPVINLSNLFNAQTNALSFTIATGIVCNGGSVIFHFNTGAWVSTAGTYAITLTCVNSSTNITEVTIIISGYFTTGMHYHLSRPYFHQSLPAGTYKLNMARSSTNVKMDINNYINIVMQEIPF